MRFELEHLFGRWQLFIVINKVSYFIGSYDRAADANIEKRRLTKELFDAICEEDGRSFKRSRYSGRRRI